MSKKTILFVSYYFDPMMLTATRNFYLAHELAKQGHEVHILGRVSEKAKKYLLPNQYIHEVSGFDYRKILYWLGAKDGVTNNLIKRPAFVSWAHKLLLKFPWNKWVAEGGGQYLTNAIRKGDKIIKEHNIEFIYSSYRPMADHFIAQALKTKNQKIKWVGDFRDVLWWKRNNSHYKEPWIKNLITDMDYRTAVTKGIADFWSTVINKTFVPMYNGLPYNILPVEKKRNARFEINYTGRIYTEFQQADLLLKTIKEIINEQSEFAKDVLIRYSGFQFHFWEEWIKKYELQTNSHISFQVSQDTAIRYQSNAGINILLTWCNDEIQGFIHGKFNEYLIAKKPIVCIVNGTMDLELKSMYDNLSNTLIVCNTDENKAQLKKFVLEQYNAWKSGAENLIPSDQLAFYNWNLTAKPFFDFINKN